MSLTAKITILTLVYFILLIFIVSADLDVKSLDEFIALPEKSKFGFTVLKYGIMLLFWYVFFLIKTIRKSRNIHSI